MTTLVAIGGSLVLLAIALLILPLHAARQAVFRFALAAAQSAVLALVAMCGTFFVRPSTVPEAAAPKVDPYLAMIRDWLPEPFTGMPGLPWLIVALTLLAFALPLLSLLEFAVRVVGQTATIQALRRELRILAKAIDNKLASDDSPKTQQVIELVAASEALHEIAGSKPTPRTPTAKLVKDLM